MNNPKIAFLGLGAMGRRMAGRLLDAGYPLSIYNRTPAAGDELVERGAKLASCPREAAVGAAIVFAMVTNDAASRAIWLDSEIGALAGMSRGAIAVESSTVTPTLVVELAEAARKRGLRFVDAPVAGSRPQATAGKLIHLIGGDPETVMEIKPVLAVMGGAYHHLGPIGAGATLKLAVNALFGIQVAAYAEAIRFLERGGIDKSAAAEALTAMPITSPAAALALGAMNVGNFAPQFPIDLVAKDFGYVGDAGNEFGATVPMAEAARQVFERAVEAGYGNENITAVAKLY